MKSVLMHFVQIYLEIEFYGLVIQCWLAEYKSLLTACTLYSGVYEPFDILTSDALQHAMSEHGYKYDERLVVALMAAYNRLKE